MSTKSSTLLTYLHANGASPSRELIEHFGISRATLSRWIRALGDHVITIGKTASTTYATRDSNAAELPLYRIKENGKAVHLGTLTPLARGEWFLKPEIRTEALFHGEFKDGLYPGWPWFLADLRPSGFLGRAFARRMAHRLDLDTNPENWSDQDVAHTLSKYGSDLTGDFIIGEQALETYLHHAPKTLKELPETSYSELAQWALEDGARFGSSAGGEQQKFSTCVGRAERIQHVIVKFSPPIDQPAGRRWADLLIAEHCANQILNEHGFDTAKTRIQEIDGRVFLESERFDRIGAKGRRGLVTLRALDAAFAGQGSGSWIKCAQKLQAAKLLSSEDCEHITRLWLFGQLIANTDMHFGNLSFYLDDSFPVQLAPCYDMLPMQFRPAPSGEIPTAHFAPRLPLPEYEAAWQSVHPIALQFWKSLSEQENLSPDFRSIASKSHDTIQRLDIE